ncbi:MAG: YCF48-related protein [Candidatus Electryonea clarkiae]|nr:YCF48-related protein [Candidatus Electryonea clarkiae]MDP8285473.1 YCF48-related protein [Candidatus Electryonea clarkiae]
MFVSRTVKIILFVGVIALLNYKANAQEWVHSGPYGAWVTSIAIDPNDTSDVYCGTGARGIWKSEDSGQNWFSISEGLPLHDDTTFGSYYRFGSNWWTGGYRQVEILKVNPQQEGEIWASFIVYDYPDIWETNLLYISDDGGANWENITGEMPDSVKIMDLAFHPQEEQTIFIARTYGLYKSEDCGETWENIDIIRDTFDYGSVIEFVPGEEEHLIYGFVAGMLMESFDGGETWDTLCTNPGPGMLTINPVDTESMWARNLDFERPQLIHSQDGGATWDTEFTPFPDDQYGYVRNLHIDNSGNLYVHVNDNIYKSEDEGQSWEMIQSYITNPRWATNIISNPHRDSSVYFGSFYGLFHSDDGGSTIYYSDEGIDNVSINVIVPHPTEPEIAYVGGDNGLWKTSDRGENWQRIATEEVLTIAIDHLYPDTLYWGGEYLKRSFNGGDSVEDIAFERYDSDPIYSLAIHPGETNIVYLGMNSRFYRSEDYGTYGSFEQVDIDDMGSGPIYTIVAGINDDDNVYFGQEGLYMSTNSARSFGRISDPGGILYSLAFSQDSEEVIAYAFDPYGEERLLYSSNGGRNFANIIDYIQVERGFWKAIIHPLNDNLLLVATQEGIYSTYNFGDSWDRLEGPYNNRSPYIAFSSDTRTAYIGTYGYGIWSATDVITSIHSEDNCISFPSSYFLVDTYPNPFNSNVSIDIFKSQDFPLSIMIYNIHGKLVKSISDDSNSSGLQRYSWDGLSRSGTLVSSGNYIINVHNNSFSQNKKITLLR